MMIDNGTAARTGQTDKVEPPNRDMRVIGRRWLPAPVPGLVSWLCIITAMDYWRAPLWLWYVGLTLLSVLTLALYINRFGYEKWVHPRELR